MKTDIIELYSTYEKSVNSKIDALKNEFEFVYHIMHPFELNLDGLEGIYNSRLEDEIFDYRLKDVILKHFGTLNGITDESTVDFRQFLHGMFDDSLKLKDVERWWQFRQDGKLITKKSHPNFIAELHSLAKKHFKESEEWDYYTDDDYTKHLTWNWRNITWKELCEKYGIQYDTSLRLSRLNTWFYENGTPKNIRYSKELLDHEQFTKVKAAIKKRNIEYKINQNQDMYVTLLGANVKLDAILHNFKFEFLSV